MRTLVIVTPARSAGTRSLPAALDGVDTVIDVANVTTTNKDKAVRYFTGSVACSTGSARPPG
jgi:hypothetical protein